MPAASRDMACFYEITVADLQWATQHAEPGLMQRPSWRGSSTSGAERMYARRLWWRSGGGSILRLCLAHALQGANRAVMLVAP